MSEEKTALMRAGIDAWNCQDIEAVVAVMHPDVRFEHRLAALQGKFVGIEAVRRWFADLTEHFDTWRIDCPDIRELDDKVLALGTNHATGTESGLETELPFTVVARIEDGLITDFIDFGDRAQALEAVGLRE